MDTISRYRKKLIEPYGPSGKSTDVINSAKELAVAVLRNPNLILKHKRKVLSEVQWLISGVNGKYSTLSHQTRRRSRNFLSRVDREDSARARHSPEGNHCEAPSQSGQSRQHSRSSRGFAS
jgi:hypothetical protein